MFYQNGTSGETEEWPLCLRRCADLTSPQTQMFRVGMYLGSLSETAQALRTTDLSTENRSEYFWIRNHAVRCFHVIL